ncbi:hypothetical protein [Metasolibacillus sp.]|uniref:hypothetical protein n=1 Tax=Metasolibacillus sp. TaxID=2703680 RepID=UPI0025DD5267|nr:hypothetical protein [Metasolibacillus sp.]MCT6922993.1 hypothetical protein [Metasolibacillus sp.]MCT6939231.1 hypothetical protein [Metasolibacillus sp.]
MLLLFLINHWAFFILVMVLMITGGLLSFLLPRVPTIIFLLFFVAISFGYTRLYDAAYFTIPILLITCIFTAIPIVLVKYTLYLQQIGERLETSS